MKSDIFMLKIALPNKGSLSEDAVQLIREAGYNCRRYSRERIVFDNTNQVEFVFLRPQDIAIYVSEGIPAKPLIVIAPHLHFQPAAACLDPSIEKTESVLIFATLW